LYEYKIAKDVFIKEQKNLSKKPFLAIVNRNGKGLSLEKRHSNTFLLYLLKTFYESE